MFKRRKKPVAVDPPMVHPEPGPVCDNEFSPLANAMVDCSRCGNPIGRHRMLDDRSLGGARVTHNPHQQLIPAGSGKTVTDLVAEAGDNVPALVGAMTVMASRFSQFVDNIHQLNTTLGDFKREVVGPLQQELKYLRYTTGERLNHASTNLEVYVRKLDQVMWGALRATGMTDEQIRRYREENGMQPEAPTGPELEVHIERVQALEESNRQLLAQNRRLLAQLDTRHTFQEGEDGWVWHHGCLCEQCKAETTRVANAHQEADR
jgi:hypothetical protein